MKVKLLLILSPSQQKVVKGKIGFRAKIKPSVLVQDSVKTPEDLRWHLIDHFRQTNSWPSMSKASPTEFI